MSSAREMWHPMPDGPGAFWFAPDLSARTDAVFTRVMWSGAVGALVVRPDPGTAADPRPITPADGWWLRIPDRRSTAAVNPGMGVVRAA